jgi:hypothetical protein
VLILFVVYLDAMILWWEGRYFFKNLMDVW